jgi:chromosome segregation ATPase
VYFLVEKSGKAVITYYPVDFQLGDPKTNSKMLQVLFEALREHKKKREELEIRISERNLEIDEEVSVLNAQKEAIETKLNHIREVITQRKSEKVTSKAELDSCNADIKSIEEKIVRSKFAT